MIELYYWLSHLAIIIRISVFRTHVMLPRHSTSRQVATQSPPLISCQLVAYCRMFFCRLWLKAHLPIWWLRSSCRPNLNLQSPWQRRLHRRLARAVCNSDRDSVEERQYTKQRNTRCSSHCRSLRVDVEGSSPSSVIISVLSSRPGVSDTALVDDLG